MVKEENKGLQEITVNTNTFLGSAFAQIVGVTVTDVDITLEFVYKHPREGVKEAQVVSRITMPRSSGEDLAKAIFDTIRLHEAKKKGTKNG